MDEEWNGISPNGRRALVIVLALVVLSVLVVSIRGAVVRGGPTVIEVSLPQEPRGYDGLGRAILDADTNLPDRTIVDLYAFWADVETPWQSFVSEGRVEIRVTNAQCHDTEVGLVGTAVRIQVTVQAEHSTGRFSGGRVGGPRPPGRQPREVQEELGPNFEHVTGPQVREEDGQRFLETSQLYELPAETCTRKLKYGGGGSLAVVALDTPVDIPTGPFPKHPFAWCPDVGAVDPVEAGDFEELLDVAAEFDAALGARDTETLGRLADPSVRSFDGWDATGEVQPGTGNNIPSAMYLPSVVEGCGSLVALRTAGSTVGGDGTSVTYLAVVRDGTWRVWGWLPGDGR